MIAAAVMVENKVILKNVPRILDIFRMIEVIESLGAKVFFDENTLTIDSSNVNSWSPDEEPVRKLRGSVVIIGPLLSKFGKANFSEPGGCLIGSRPIDFHLKAFSDLGINVKANEVNTKYSLESGDNYRKGDKKITLEEMSVTTTENVIMAAVLREGKTVIDIAACEPEIADLANFLNQAGAKISGAGTHTIEVTGVKSLHSVEYEVMPDRIEAGTIAIAAAVCGGRVEIENIIPDHLSLVLNKFKLINIDYEIKANGKWFNMIVDQKSKLVAPNVKWIDTRPYPGFPTDLQSPFAVLLTQAEGRTRMFETIFDSRFDYVKWLDGMGADISVENPHIIVINGPTKLHGKEIECSDLRGGAALVIAALCAEGESIIDNIEYVDRGYESFDKRLQVLGADSRRID
jgi:UDP-N-acetylglucosamine 1-carboxyvinyltransferase